jgi:riboflavin kinase/FMN adenylyltransferase
MMRVRLEALGPVGWPAPAVTVGNFDGTHRGHQALVAVALQWARAERGTVVVLTFDPHPARILTPLRAPAALTTLDQKEEILAGLGVDRLAVLPFTESTAQLPPEAFARQVLVGALGARLVVVGESFRFGHRRAGDPATLRLLGEALGFSVRTVPPVLHAGSPVSSSRVREAVLRGDMAEATALLGRTFFVDGTVVRGDGRGRSLGIPTANVSTENEILPGRGVYAGRGRVLTGDRVPAVINIGERPTFGGGESVLEAHLIDFATDLYGTRLRLEFHARLRDERRFPGPDALVAQIRADIVRTRALLSGPRENTV